MVYIKFNTWNDKWDKNGKFPLSKRECEEVQELIEYEKKYKNKKIKLKEK